MGRPWPDCACTQGSHPKKMTPREHTTPSSALGDLCMEKAVPRDGIDLVLRLQVDRGCYNETSVMWDRGSRLVGMVVMVWLLN